MLQELFDKLDKGCDKFAHYFDLYELWFGRFVGRSPRILEVGIQFGGSAELWHRYFGSGTIVYGVDIAPQCEETEYLKIHRGDQGSAKFWHGFQLQYGDHYFDIIIDDGSHINSHQITTLQNTYSLLKDRGIYWCEDTHTSYYRNDRISDGGYLSETSFIEYAKIIVDVLNKEHTFRAIGVGPTPDNRHVDKELVDLYECIRGMHFYDSVVLIEKGPRPEFSRVIREP